MKKITIFCSILLLMALLLSTAHSKEQESIFNGIRCLGMGSAFVAVADNHSALQHNVAGLSRVEGRDLVLLNFMAVGTDDFRKAYFDDDLTDLMDSEDLNDLDGDTLDKLYHYDLSSRFAAQFLTYVDHIDVVNHYGLGVYGTSDVTVDIDRDVAGLPIAEYNIKAATIAMAGYARDFSFQLPFFTDESAITAGLALKYYNVGRLQDYRHVLELMGYAGEDIPKWDGNGIGVDLGFLYPFRVLSRNLTFGLAIHDVGGTKIAYKDDPDGVVPANVRWGVSYQPDMSHFPIFRHFLLSVEYDDFFNGQDKTFGEHIHLGMETYTGYIKLLKRRLFRIALRGGFNQGYPAVGGGIDWRFGGIEYAFFGREAGSYVGQHPLYSHAVQLRLLTF